MNDKTKIEALTEVLCAEKQKSQMYESMYDRKHIELKNLQKDYNALLIEFTEAIGLLQLCGASFKSDMVVTNYIKAEKISEHFPSLLLNRKTQV